MRAYLDSCVVMYLVEKREPWLSELERRLLPPSGRVPEVYFSDLTRMECRVGPKRNPALVEHLPDYDKFFDAPGFSRIPLDTRVFDLATDLRAEYSLKTPDALHLAAAMRAQCDELWTADKQFFAVETQPLRIVSITV